MEGEIDWDRRYRLMRMHTAMHLLCSLIKGAAVTGGSVGADRSRLDFDLPNPPPKEDIEAGLNALIDADHPVRIEWVDEAVLDANPGLVRTMSVAPPRGTGRLRLMRIGDADAPVDLQPCGGTHVARTGEIGRMLGREDREQGPAEPPHHHRASGIGLTKDELPSRRGATRSSRPPPPAEGTANARFYRSEPGSARSRNSKRRRRQAQHAAEQRFPRTGSKKRDGVLAAHRKRDDLRKGIRAAGDVVAFRK